MKIAQVGQARFSSIIQISSSRHWNFEIFFWLSNFFKINHFLSKTLHVLVGQFDDLWQFSHSHFPRPFSTFVKFSFKFLSWLIFSKNKFDFIAFPIQNTQRTWHLIVISYLNLFQYLFSLSQKTDSVSCCCFFSSESRWCKSFDYRTVKYLRNVTIIESQDRRC